MPAGPVGIIANPASGKDIRRVVARASTFDNQEKRNIVRRAIAGAIAAGATEFRYLPDGYGIVSEAAEESAADASFAPVESPGTASALDTIRAARQMHELGCSVVLTLGGDGTNRAVALGWRDAPVVPISTGTNNVFPRMIEATVAGAAAGLIASGAVALHEVSSVAKLVHAEIAGERDDLALIDAVLLGDLFVGARAIWDSTRLRLAVMTRAEPAAVGVSALGGLLCPVSSTDDHALSLTFGGEAFVVAPIAPGLYQDVPVKTARLLPLGEWVSLEGPGVLAFDGERERVLKPGQEAQLRVLRDGPRVVDIERALQLAACRGVFRGGAIEVGHGD
ncbi:MAG: NAD(+)/NADH kinase [Chloroflexi bacterium]|nr:NAD(+)/NADH kinase [Chloroflexota bacterium]